jgi:hypothetical protein
VAALPVSGASLGGLPSGAGAAPVPAGMGGLPGLLGTGGLAGLPGSARAVAAKRAPSLASEIRPGTATQPTAKAAGSGVPPMMSPPGGQGAAGTLRPGSAEHPTGRAGGSRRPTVRTDGVPAKLRGRAAGGSPEAGFTLPRGRRDTESEPKSVQLLDEELWRPTP